MAGVLAAAAVKTVGVKNLGKALAVLVVLLLAGLTTAIGAPIMIVAAFAAPASSQPGTDSPIIVGAWGKPISTYVISRGFGLDPHPCSVCSKFHRGIDLAGPAGTPVFAAGPGTVIHAGIWGAFGNAVEIDHGGGLVSVYGHMGYGTLRVSVGQRVGAGVQIGQRGSTGHSSGPHLHFELRQNGVAFDPEPFMARLGLPL